MFVYTWLLTHLDRVIDQKSPPDKNIKLILHLSQHLFDFENANENENTIVS